MGGTNWRQEHPGNVSSLENRVPESERRLDRREKRGMFRPDCAAESRGGFRAIGVAASKLATPIVARRGGGILTRLKAHWGVIVGAEWAVVTWPTALSREGVLKVRAASGSALELQHCAPVLIERINLFFGRSVIARLTLVQGVLPLATPVPEVRLRPLTPGEMKVLDEWLGGVAEPGLRDALARLGRAVIGEER